MKKIFLLLAVLLLSGDVYAKPHENVWTPDTCDCQVIYEFDDELPADQRVHTFKRITKHDVTLPLLTGEQEYEAILENNIRKSKVHTQLLTISTLIQTNPDGSIGLKNGVTMNWSWVGVGASKVLSISVSGANLANPQKSAVQSWCDTNIGIGKVIIA